MATFDINDNSDTTSRAIDIERYAKLLAAVKNETVSDLTRTFVNAVMESGQFNDPEKLRAVADGIYQALGDK